MSIEDEDGIIHLSTPGPDLGSFSTTEVRSSSSPVDLTSRSIRFPRHNYKSPPNVAGGFKSLHLSASAPGVRANLVGSHMSAEGFRIGLETWDGGIMYEAAATWIEHKSDAKECHFGQIDTLDEDVKPPSKKPVRRIPLQRSFSSTHQVSKRAESQSYTRTVDFPAGFKEPPEVICWINRLDFGTTSSARSFNLRASANDISTTKATLRLTSSNETELNGAAMCWIAFPKDKKHVASGVFATSDDTSTGQSRIQKTEGRVKFKKGWFEKVPTVLVALDMLDLSADKDLRIRVETSNVTSSGFDWVVETWDDSILHAGSASWIALAFP